MPPDVPRAQATTRRPAYTKRHLLALADLDADSLRALLAAAHRHAQGPAPGSADRLRGRSIGLLFFEASTRTRVSFTAAAQRLGAHVLDCSGAGTSAAKGETLIDTARTVESSGVDALVLRHAASGAADLVAARVDCPVINGGDGRHEHPTQGLIDAYTLCEAQQRVDGFDLTGLKVAIVGDVVHSRVARSACAAMRTLGADVQFVGPPGLCPASLEALGARVEHDLDAILPEMDAVMALRVQFERAASLASETEYRALYQLDEPRAARMKPSAVVMHPGPMNRGLEIAGAVADGPRSVIRRQVEVGVAVRMGVFETLLAPAQG